MSERLLNKPGDDIVFNLQPVCQHNPITGEVIKESDKAPVVKEKPVDVIEKSTVVKESDKASVVAAVVIEKSAVDEKDNTKVTSKYKRKTGLPMDNQKDKESDKAPVVAAVVSGKSAVDEKDNRKVTSKVSKVSDKSDKATVVLPVLKEKPADVIEKLTVVKESDKAPVVKESDKVPVVKESDKAPVVAPVLKEKLADVIEKSTVVHEKEKPTVDITIKVAKDKEKPSVDVTSNVGKSKAVVHKYKALDVVSKDKPKGIPPCVVGKGNALSVVGKVNDKPSVVKGKLLTELPKKKHKADIPKDKPKPKDKHKVDSEVHVLRSKPEVKAKASVSKDVKHKRMLSKEDRSKKKLELKMIKGKMVSDEVDSDEIKTEYSDEESGLKSNKKGKKKKSNSRLKKLHLKSILMNFQLFVQGDCLEIEQQLLEVEAEAGYAIIIADEEIILEEQAMSGSVTGYGKLTGLYTTTGLLKDNSKDKESDKAPVVAAFVSEKLAVDEKDNRKEKPANVIEKLIVVKDSDKAPGVKESDKMPVVKESDKAPIVAPVAKDKEKLAVDVTSKVGKSKAVVHKYKALDAVLKDKPKGILPSVVGKGNASSVVGKENDKPPVVKRKLLTELLKKKHKADIPKDKPKPKYKHKVDSEVPVLRSKPDVKAKASVSEDVKRKRMSSNEDRSKKKLELKMIEGKMVSNEVDSDEIKTEYFDEESGLKSNKKGTKKKSNSRLKKLHIKSIFMNFQLFVQEIGFSSFHNVSLIKYHRGWEAKEKLASICSERVILEDLIRKASSDYPDGGNDNDGDDKGDDDNDDGNENNDEELNDDNDDGNRNNDEELNDKDTLGSNLSFGFSKIGLDDLDKQPSQEGTDAEKESGDLFGDNSLRMEVSNQGPPTLDRMPTHDSNASASPRKRIVKPSSYLLSPYMNKKTKLVPKITRLKFSIGNSLFAMQGDKFQNLCLMVHYLLMMTNREDSQIKLRLSLKGNEGGFALQGIDLVFFPICNHSHFYVVVFSLTSTTSMTILDKSVTNYDTKYKEVFDLLKKLFARHLRLYGHSRHGTALGNQLLSVSLLIRLGKHDCVERISSGNSLHTTLPPNMVDPILSRLKHRILKLKWRTSGKFHDCEVFTMLHMESFNGETVAK
nr:hypothetical protein [Tanacetum cinerariifolium]